MKKLLGVLTLLVAHAAAAADFAITMDDFNIGDTTRLTAPQRNERILRTLDRHHVKAALFVVCRNLESSQGRSLLQDWSRGGHLIGNHTYSHRRYGANTSFADFSADAARCHQMLQGVPGFQPFFRFPALAEGDTVEKRDLMRAWLGANGYRAGPVSIDASDWYIDERLRQKLATEPQFDPAPFRDFYLQHMWQRATYYNELAKQVLGHEVKHTLLVHFNLLNALFLGDLIDMFRSHGWRLVDAADAFKDPVYARSPDGMPSGQSLIWGLAKETGRFGELRYPGEDGSYEQAAMDSLGL
ncbi:MAG: polysaccharide deacetylase family protein [Steroidobacteraceae bacterium]